MAPGSRLEELTAKYMQNPRRFFVPLANEYRRAGDLDRAIALCREHLPAQPGHMSGYIVLGRAYFEKGDLEAARDVLLTSVSLDDENLIALRHLGDIGRLRGDGVDARQWYARVLDADPDNAEIDQLLRSLDAAEAITPFVPLQTRVTDAAGPDDAPPVNVIARPTPVRPTPIATRPVTWSTPLSTESVLAMPPAQPVDAASALTEPTPPGLKAIVDGSRPGALSEAGRTIVEDDAAPARAPVGFETFDLSTFGLDVELENTSVLDLPHDTPALEPTETQTPVVPTGAGFVFSELDELVDPTSSGDRNSGTLVPDQDTVVVASDFADSLIPPRPTPSSAPGIDAAAEDVLARPGFGALASFASWRSAQSRETPKSTPAIDERSAESTAPVAEETVVETDLFWREPATEPASSAPEFVTETMASLYAQQGFTAQALEIYRELLDRSPSDERLQQAVRDLEQVTATDDTDILLQEDADKAFSFKEMHGSGSGESEGGDAPESADSSAEGSLAERRLDSTATPGAAASLLSFDVGDDWFAGDGDHDPIGQPAAPAESIFGVPEATFSEIQHRTDVVNAVVPRVPIALDGLFGVPVIASADESAGGMLASLATEMIGRLPKESPSLPVPEVLELPVPGGAGASPAPLLSFDRFFSGTGSVPRIRADTPVPSSGGGWSNTGAPSPASLSPTFGGVPVIPPSSPAVPAFDQFLAGSHTTPGRAAALPSDAQVADARQEDDAQAKPSSAGAERRTPSTAIPVTWMGQLVTGGDAAPAVPADAERPAASPVQPVSPEPGPEKEPDLPASDFHRWLEGLS